MIPRGANTLDASMPTLRKRALCGLWDGDRAGGGVDPPAGPRAGVDSVRADAAQDLPLRGRPTVLQFYSFCGP